jgi:L-cysteine/cystine lyase
MIEEDARLHAHRSKFAALGRSTYLNFGARGVLCDGARSAAAQSLDTLQETGVSSRVAKAWIEYETVATRQALAHTVGARADRVALVESVSAALSAALWGLPWCKGDHALVCEREPPGTLFVLSQLARRFELELTFFPAPAELTHECWVKQFAECLRPTTRMVVVSEIDWVSGQKIQLQTLVQAVRNGPSPTALVCLDGAQAVGVIPVDMTASGVDVYVFGTQKWLCGPDGLAALCVSESACAALSPAFLGWRALAVTPDGANLVIASDARRFELGSAAYSLFASARAALDFQDAFAPIAQRSKRVLALTRYLRERLLWMSREHPDLGLQALESSPDSGITGIACTTADPSEIVRQLDVEGIVVREHFMPRSVRVCAHYLTLRDELDRLCDALVATVSRAKRRIRA